MSDRIGPYRLVQQIGEGGMGVVHLGLDPENRTVAVKVLRHEVAGDRTARRRLAREVETMRRVHSRNVAEIVDADVTGESPYIVTQYVPGRPLDSVIDERGALRGGVLVRVAVGLASALAAIHGAGIIHRDLKPANVMLVDGDPIVIDFGIAQAVDTTRLTQTGMFIGTPGYLAPEVIQGNEVGPESDIHALAATLIYAATGHPPFGSGGFELVFFKILQGQPDLSGVPGALEPILRAALDLDPANRPDAAELLRRLRGVRLDDDVSSPAGPAGRAAPPGPAEGSDRAAAPGAAAGFAGGAALGAAAGGLLGAAGAGAPPSSTSGPAGGPPEGTPSAEGWGRSPGEGAAPVGGPGSMADEPRTLRQERAAPSGPAGGPPEGTPSAEGWGRSPGEGAAPVGGPDSLADEPTTLRQERADPSAPRVEPPMGSAESGAPPSEPGPEADAVTRPHAAAGGPGTRPYTRQTGNTDYRDVLPPVQYAPQRPELQQGPSAVPVASAPPGGYPPVDPRQQQGYPDPRQQQGYPPQDQQQRRPGWLPLLTLLCGVIAVGVSIVFPPVATVVILVILVLLRAADRAQSKLAVRRSERGAKASDAFFVILGTPWGLVRGALIQLLMVPLAAVVAAVVLGLLVYFNADVPTSTLAGYASGAFMFMSVLGPGSGAPRRGLNRVIGLAARGGAAISAVSVVLSLLALLTVGVAIQRSPVWEPWHITDSTPQEIADQGSRAITDQTTGWVEGIVGDIVDNVVRW